MHISIWLQVQCIVMLILGQALHLFLLKVPSLKARARAAGKPFSWKEWWCEDWNIVVSTLIIGALVTVGLNELVTWKPEILDYVKWFYAAIGAFGSTVAQAKFSQYEKKLLAVIDIKSNVSDEVTGGTTTVKETIEKAAVENIHVSVTQKKTGSDGK